MTGTPDEIRTCNLLIPRALPVEQEITGSHLACRPLAGGLPKAVELHVACAISDLGDYGLGKATNGGGSGAQSFTFDAGPAQAGSFLYVSYGSGGEFEEYFGWAPNATSSAANVNGDDAVELCTLRT